MAGTIEGRSVWKWIFINALVVVFGAFLYWSVYGVLAGIFIAAPIGNTPEYKKFLEETLTPDQWKAVQEGRIKRRDILELIRQQDKEGKFFSMYWEHVKSLNWHVLNPAANATVFGMLGFTLGLMRIFKYVALIPTLLLWITYPLLTSALFSEVHYSQTGVFLSISVQFVSIYLFSWMGMRLRHVVSRSQMRKRDHSNY